MQPRKHEHHDGHAIEKGVVTFETLVTFVVRDRR
jgi:hypothetical protein